MNLVEFCENRFQELRCETELTDHFNARADSELKAVHSILGMYRIALKWAMVPKCLLDFLLVKMCWRDAPEPVIMNKIKADQLAKKVAEEMLQDGKVTGINSHTNGQIQTETPST